MKVGHTFEGKRLKDHVIRSLDAIDADDCELHCFWEPDCVSFNFKKSMSQCELNNSTFEEKQKKLETHYDYIYREAENECVNNRCENNATCQTGFTDKGYRCLCTAGFEGNYCEIDVDECASGTHKCGAETNCTNNKGSYNCTCNLGYYGDAENCEPVLSSCKDVFDKNISSENKAYPLLMENKVTYVYCHMTMATISNGECSDGGWTLVMKIDGNQQTFHYTSEYWQDKNTFNVVGGKTGFDSQETKLPSYWNTSFTKICLGMKINDQINFIVINQGASSLYSLIADGQYRNTSLGREAWMSLAGSEASLQLNCKMEGFNAKCITSNRSKARIGILGNDQTNCYNCNSRLGFGTAGNFDNNNTNTCGNEAKHGGDNGNKLIRAMGYILVQ
ncbi:uncharacterized protein [Porites lutea]|uniref:uncharacterized protein n=1 Tax=Porites lutea TaxID=51062 RepID=UPI003CC68E35